MNGPVLLCIDFTGIIDRITYHVEYSSKYLFPDRNFDWTAKRFDFVTTHKPFTHIHRNRSDTVVSDNCRNFKDQLLLLTLHFIIHFDRFIDLRQITFKINVDYRSDNL
ncbi:hypothetical protein D3C81_1676160 [compost metagenome]